MTEARKTITIVYDDKNVLTSLQFVFETHGYRVVTYFYSGEALPAVITSPPDILILNGRMPPIHGIEFFRSYRKHHDTPVIFISAKVDELEAELSDDPVAPVAYYQVPFLIRDVLEKIALHTGPTAS